MDKPSHRKVYEVLFHVKNFLNAQLNLLVNYQLTQVRDILMQKKNN